MSANKFLFSQYDLGNVLRNQEQSMFGEVDSIESNELLNTSIEDLCQYFEQKYKLDPPRLKIDKTTVDQGETKEDVKLDFGRIVSVKGTKITYFIPFEGDPKLFRCKPSRWSPTRPRAVIRGNEVLLSYIPADHDANVIKSEFERHSSLIVEYLEAVERDVAPFNASIREKAHARLEASRKKLLADQGLVASLGFSLYEGEKAHHELLLLPRFEEKFLLIDYLDIQQHMYLNPHSPRTNMNTSYR